MELGEVRGQACLAIKLVKSTNTYRAPAMCKALFQDQKTAGNQRDKNSCLCGASGSDHQLIPLDMCIQFWE